VYQIHFNFKQGESEREHLIENHTITSYAAITNNVSKIRFTTLDDKWAGDYSATNSSLLVITGLHTQAYYM
jgi:hypothetical protein